MTKVTIDRALIEQALEAIELNWKTDEGDAVKPLLRAALAKPAVEPVGYVTAPITWKSERHHSEQIMKITQHRQPMYGFVHPIYVAPPPAKPAVEPFGYFRAEPFGWTDCAPTDEGAKALYEVPPPAEPAVDNLSAIEKEIAETCMDTPPGWRCTRRAGHDGPCAAVPAPEDIEFVRKGMARLKESEAPPPPAEPAPVPWLSEEEIGRIFLKFEGSLQSLRDCANEIEKAYRREAGL